MSYTIVRLGPTEVHALKMKALKGDPRVNRLDPFIYWFHSRWHVLLGKDIFTIAYPVGWNDSNVKIGHPADGLYLRYDECTDFKIEEGQ